MTPNDIIEGILEREGEQKPPYLVEGDKGGRTNWGISERAYPEYWKDGHVPDKEDARQIYWHEYVTPWNSLIGINEPLRICCIDDSVMSGVETAKKQLQEVLGVLVDGIIGTETINAVLAISGKKLVKNYTVARTIRLARLVQKRPTDLKFLVGWLNRTLSFLP